MNQFSLASSLASTLASPKRVIGMLHRVKLMIRDDVVIESHPTQIAVFDTSTSKTVEYKLDNETNELDFLLGRFPIAWRKLKDDEVVPEGVLPHHLIQKEKGSGVERSVPVSFDGLQAGDCVLTQMGGSGQNFTFALSRRSEKIGATVSWVNATLFKRLCDEHGIIRAKYKETSDDGKRSEIGLDHTAVIALAKISSDSFHEVDIKARELILLRGLYQTFIETQGARIGCEQRLRQRAIGKIFCTTEGEYPEGAVEDKIKEVLANSAVLSAFKKEERQAVKDLEEALSSMSVWKNVFEPIQGVGPRIAARLVVSVGDIGRFETESKLTAFLGAHVLKSDGKKFVRGEKPENGILARRRTGQLSNWQPEGRQALYLVADQFVRRPDSVWGKKLRVYKANFRAKHPYPQVWEKDAKGVVICKHDLLPEKHKRTMGGWELMQDDGSFLVVKGATKYNDGHIHKMAIWRAITRFVRFLFKAWKRSDRGIVTVPSLENQVDVNSKAGDVDDFKEAA